MWDEKKDLSTLKIYKVKTKMVFSLFFKRLTFKIMFVLCVLAKCAISVEFKTRWNPEGAASSSKIRNTRMMDSAIGINLLI